jgi:hypothetical protein
MVVEHRNSLRLILATLATGVGIAGCRSKFTFASFETELPPPPKLMSPPRIPRRPKTAKSGEILE